jgi:ankyrin repeat protein
MSDSPPPSAPGDLDQQRQRAEQLDVEAFCAAVRAGDAARTSALLERPHVRTRVNDPMFDFGQRAAHIAATNEALLTALLDAGADLGLKSAWQNGPYTVLDRADDRTARFLLTRGAALTPNAAARLGWLDELTALLDADPTLVHARGGDGQQPLHEAKTVTIADLVLDRGADIDTPCIDHRATPAQYALVERPDVCRRLLERGARPDIFMAAHLGDLGLATRLLDADPGCIGAHINEPGYAPVPHFHIYCWTLGFGRSPHDVARKAGQQAVYDLLVARSPAAIRFVNAALSLDEPAAAAVLSEQPALLASLNQADHGRLAQAIFYESFAAAAVMLRLGFDPAAPGIDGGTALHAACWVGNIAMVDEILKRGRVPVDARDPTHGSTPLGWTAFGSVHRRAAGGNYSAVIDRLVAAGADIGAPGNGEGRTLLQMAAGNQATEQTLRRHGAT